MVWQPGLSNDTNIDPILTVNMSRTHTTGRLGEQTMGMNGGSAASYLTCTPCVHTFRPSPQYCWDFPELRCIMCLPWTNTSLGGNFWRTFRAIGPCRYPWKHWSSYGPMAPKSLWKFRSTPALAHGVLFSAEEIPEKFRKDPGNAHRVFPEIALKRTAGNPQALWFKACGASRALPEIFSPSVPLETPLFPEVVPERASQSCCHGILSMFFHSMARLAHMFCGRSSAEFISPLLLQAKGEWFGKVPILLEPRHAIWDIAKQHDTKGVVTLYVFSKGLGAKVLIDFRVGTMTTFQVFFFTGFWLVFDSFSTFFVEFSWPPGQEVPVAEKNSKRSRNCWPSTGVKKVSPCRRPTISTPFRVFFSATGRETPGTPFRISFSEFASKEKPFWPL